MHYSFSKAADLLGLGTAGLVTVPRSRDDTIDIDACKLAVEECERRKILIIALVGIAGNTDSGAVDALDLLADLAEEHGIHFHVDAAWGGPFLFSRKHRSILKGIERADTITLDAHKQFHVPIGTGIVCLKQPDKAKCIEKQAAYMIRPESIDLGKRSLEGSRPANVLALHAAMYLIGIRGYEYLVDRSIDTARLMAEQIRAMPDFELLLEPKTNIVLYRYVPPALKPRGMDARKVKESNGQLNQINKFVQQRQYELGNAFVSRTTITNDYHGVRVPIVALRAVIANPFVTETDIAWILSEQRQVAKQAIVSTC